MQPSRLHLLVLALLVVSGCASRGAGGASIDRNQLTSDEIAAGGHADALSAVRALRPQWLRTRGSSITAQEMVRVYLDNTALGGPDALQQVPTLSIASMRYLSSSEATQRWGTGHTQGAIVIATRARQDAS